MLDLGAGHLGQRTRELAGRGAQQHLHDRATTSWPASWAALTRAEPTRPVAPRMAIFMAPLSHPMPRVIVPSAVVG